MSTSLAAGASLGAMAIRSALALGSLAGVGEFLQAIIDPWSQPGLGALTGAALAATVLVTVGAARLVYRTAAALNDAVRYEISKHQR